MERGSLARWLFLGAAIFLFVSYGWPAITGKTDAASELQPLAGVVDNARPKEQAEEQLCKISGKRFEAELTSRGAALRHARMTDAKYSRSVDDGVAIDLVTTSVQSRLPLRTDLRAASGGTDQVDFNDLDWKLEAQTKTSCSFSYRDAKVALSKTFSVTERPFELKVEVAVENLDKEPHKHRFAIEQNDWRTQEETQGSWGRLSEFLTKSEVRAGGETQRFETGDFEPEDFQEPDFTAEKWRRAPGAAQWAAVSSSYFSKGIIHLKGAGEPAAETLIEEWWNQAQFPKKDSDPNYGHVYRARLAYPENELQPGAKASYASLAYLGPKERAVLSSVGGDGHDAIELLDLGMFGAIGKLLIQYLYFLYGFTKTWGWAICLLTITVKLLLFPLSIAQIKSSMAMRKLKPQMDEINEKYKDDAQMRGLAVQQLWKDNNVTNPVLGCVPVMLQMPVWFALYTSLQTAVELYHTSFGPFIPDLSAPGLYYIIPVLLGASSFLQQRLMPMQGDAMQQKMMMYMMPGIFTVMMLFLPAGLGIYFLTNTWLGIGQQLAVERYYKSRADDDDSAEKKTAAVTDEDADEDEASFGKGRTRVQQRG
jgi:YidC/Oxa1 family membrane protein insertase